jgi:cell division protein FtsL
MHACVWISQLHVSHRNRIQCLNSSLFLLDVLTADQAVQEASSAVVQSHKQQAATEEADRLSEQNTVHELSWSKLIYDRFSHSTSYMFFGLLQTDLHVCQLRVFKDIRSSNYTRT